jgi:hypothetical protein
MAAAVVTRPANRKSVYRFAAGSPGIRPVVLHLAITVAGLLITGSSCRSGSGGVEQVPDEEADRGGAEPDRDHLQPVLPPVSDQGHR